VIGGMESNTESMQLIISLFVVYKAKYTKKEINYQTRIAPKVMYQQGHPNDLSANSALTL
jgi:hypothetical protein